MLWSDFILFILVGCVMDFFWFHIIKTFMLQLFLFGMHTSSSYFVLNIIYILLSFFSHFSCKYHCNRIATGNKNNTQKVKDTKTNFRWSQPMQNLLLEILADEALHGNKQSNTVKHASYAKVAEALTEKFMIECTQSMWNIDLKHSKPIGIQLHYFVIRKAGLDGMMI